jgi:flagellar FliL protein
MSEQEPKKKSSLVKLVIAVVLAAAAAVGGVLLWGRARPGPAEKAQEHKVNAVLHLEPFTVNINDPEQKTFLRLGVDIGLERNSKTGQEPESSSLVRDTILAVLMATKPEDVSSVEGKQKLKEQLRHALQERAPEMGVREVYFTDFLLQR